MMDVQLKVVINVFFSFYKALLQVSVGSVGFLCSTFSFLLCILFLPSFGTHIAIILYLCNLSSLNPDGTMLQQHCETMICFFSCEIRFKMALASLWRFNEDSKNDTLWLWTSIHTWNDDKVMLNVVSNSWIIYLLS